MDPSQMTQQPTIVARQGVTRFLMPPIQILHIGSSDRRHPLIPQSALGWGKLTLPPHPAELSLTLPHLGCPSGTEAPRAGRDRRTGICKIHDRQIATHTCARNVVLAGLANDAREGDPKVGARPLC